MKDDSERKFLIIEITVLEESISASSTNVELPSTDDLQQYSTNELRAIKQRFERLVRSLGGAKR